MASRRQAPEDLRAPERHALADCRDRWIEFVGLDHETLAPVLDFAADGDHLLVWREPVVGRRIGDGKVPRQHAATLLLQAAAAAAFFTIRGFPLGPEDLEDAVWDVAGGSARFWLSRSPRSVARGQDSAAFLPDALLGLLDRLFGRGGRIGPGAARNLAHSLASSDARDRRPDFWVAGVLRAFPDLAGPAAAGARRRCLGAAEPVLRSSAARALAAKARALLSGKRSRIFAADGSALAPGCALGLGPPDPGSTAEASRRLRAEAASGPSSWIAVAREAWDVLSRRAFDAAVLRLGAGVEVVEVPGEAACPADPEAWRRALWIPCGTLAACVRFYEWLSGLAPSSAAEGRARASDFLASSGFARFAADPTGDAPLSLTFPLLSRSGPPSEGLAASDVRGPGRAIERALAAGETERALLAARDWIESFGTARPEAWFTLSALLAAHVGERFIPWLEALEAEREIAGGRPAEARARLERIARHAGAGDAHRRRARLRLAEVAVLLGEASVAARAAASWRRDHPDAPPDEAARALMLGAVGLSREGRWDCALGLVDEAQSLGDGLGPAERVEVALTRARVFALAGRFEEEDRVYAALRPAALESGDDRLAARFLAQEGRALLDRREFERAALRLGAALAAEDDPAERAALSIDLAATRYHGGDPKGSEAALDDAMASAAAAGREDLLRIARGNRIELLLDRGAFVEAEPEIAEEHEDARQRRDERRRLVALHHRARLALRRGDLGGAGRDNGAARELAAALGDRLEIGELWLEEGDRCAYAGDAPGARRAWEHAAADPPDRCDSDRIARSRLEEVGWGAAGPPAEASARLEALLGEDPLRGGETVARWSGLFGPDSVSANLRDRAAQVLRASGADALAECFAPRPTTAMAESALRGLRAAVAGALSGDGVGGERTLASLGLDGLTLRDAAGRELVRWETSRGTRGAERWRTLEAGAARFELALRPEIPEERAAEVALVLETLLYRADGAVVETADFAEGWRRLGLVTADRTMEEPYRRLLRFAPQPVTVLVSGESGSGKEAVARAVHRLSPRASGPFVAVNVPAIPPALAESELFGHVRGAFTGAERDRRGLLEEAGGGTLFLDEIGDLDAPLQSKLLRALQEGEIRRVGESRLRSVDFRVVSATSRDLAREAEAGRFREDLFYRLHVAPVRLPPLRERGRDVLLLARHFLERFGREYARGSLRLTADAAGALLAYPWPGNVRELQNAMAHAAALSEGEGTIGPDLLPEPLRGRRPRGPSPGDYRARVDAHRRELIADALDRSGGNRTRAARELGLSRQALLYLIKELKVEGRGS